jgi:hypothetical protein
MPLIFIHAKRPRKARKYRSPAKVIGGISCKPIFTKTQDVAQRNTTNKACITALKCGFICGINSPV